MSVKASYIKWSHVYGITNQGIIDPFMVKMFVRYVTVSFEAKHRELNDGQRVFPSEY